MKAVVRAVGPWFCVILLVVASSTVSYWFGKQTARSEGCRARHTFEAGHNKLVGLFDTLGTRELDLNPQHYPPDEVQRRRDVLAQFVRSAKVPLEDC